MASTSATGWCLLPWESTTRETNISWEFGRAAPRTHESYVRSLPISSSGALMPNRLARSLAQAHPGATASLREGLDETLTVIELGIDGALYRTLRSTNPIENLNGLIAHYTRNVKRWKDGHMLLRWIGSSLHEAAGGFRCVRGFREMKRLCSVLLQRVQPDSLVQRKVA